MDLNSEVIVWIQNNPLMCGLAWLILFDILLGSARAIIDKSFNSSAGKKGLILKVAMLLCSICAVFIDYAVNINFFAFVPESITTALNLQDIGLCEFIIILFGFHELTSILKNWSKLGLPGGSKLQELLSKYTNEL